MCFSHRALLLQQLQWLQQVKNGKCMITAISVEKFLLPFKNTIFQV